MPRKVTELSRKNFIYCLNSINKRNLRVFSGIILSISLTSIVYLMFSPSVDANQFEGRIERSIAEMYDQDDLSSCCLFAGGYINYGFWIKPLNAGFISVDQRIESEKNLYRFVLEKLGVSREDKILEIGCGKGVGSALALKEYDLKEVHGIDFSSAQILRAKETNRETIQNCPERIYFQEGAAEKIPYEQSAFDKAYSIEAAQHFENLEQFAKEAYRVLKPGGRLVVASMFGTSNDSNKKLSTMIQTIKDGIDNARPIYQFEQILKKNGFVNVNVESIGKNVWYGFDQWTAQGDLKNSWTRNWYKGYRKGFLDYYVISADKPKT